MSELQKIHEIMKSNRIFSILAYRLGMSEAVMTKESANVFEAFCYALSVDQNKDLAEPWIENLFLPLVRHAHELHSKAM